MAQVGQPSPHVPEKTSPLMSESSSPAVPEKPSPTVTESFLLVAPEKCLHAVLKNLLLRCPRGLHSVLRSHTPSSLRRTSLYEKSGVHGSGSLARCVLPCWSLILLLFGHNFVIRTPIIVCLVLLESS